jgi:hypothetical protein
MDRRATDKETTMKSRSFVLTLAVAMVLAAPCAFAGEALEEAVSGGASPGQKLGPANALFPGSVARSDSTNSRSYVTLVGPGFDIDTAGRSTLLIQFTSHGFLNEANRTLFVRAVVDGVAVNPGAMRYTGTRNASIAYTGWISGIAAGRHEIRMQWAVSGGTATIGNRTTVVTVIPE